MVTLLICRKTYLKIYIVRASVKEVFEIPRRAAGGTSAFYNHADSQLQAHSMSHFRPVKLEHASRLINHGPTVLVTSAHGGRRDVMAAAWSMPVEFTPPRIAVVIDKQTFTREL